MTVEQQAEKLIDEAYEYAPSSGGTKEAISISIAIWCYLLFFYLYFS